MMSAFGDIQGDFPDRIMAMAERQQKHEIEERRYINRTIGGTIKRSQIFAFILLFIMIVGGGLLIYEGFDIAGYLVLVPSIITTLIQVLRVFPRSPETK